MEEVYFIGRDVTFVCLKEVFSILEKADFLQEVYFWRSLVLMVLRKKHITIPTEQVACAKLKYGKLEICGRAQLEAARRRQSDWKYNLGS